jgi:hypothetical protein
MPRQKPTTHPTGPLPLNSEFRRVLFMDVIDQFPGKER